MTYKITAFLIGRLTLVKSVYSKGEFEIMNKCKFYLWRSRLVGHLPGTKNKTNMKTREYINREKNRGWESHQRGSTYIITAVPMQDQSDGHRINGPLLFKTLIRLCVRVLARKIAHPSQGTLRTAISALSDLNGTWLARLQPCLGLWLDWVGRIPPLFLVLFAPTPACTLPYGVWIRMPKTRLNAVFRRRGVLERT